MPPEQQAGENLFSPSTERLAQSSIYKSTGKPGLQTQEEPALNFLERMSKAFIRFSAVSNRREAKHRDSSFIASSSLAQKKFDFELRKQLSRFYTSDGQDLLPASDYAADLGFGMMLKPDDFMPKEGQRRTYAEIVDHMHGKFMEDRKNKAPSVRAETSADLKMRLGRLQANVSAQAFQDARQGLILANNLNATIRSYKEVLSIERGFDPRTFALHVDALMQNTEGAIGLVEPGRASNTFRMALGDMISVGVLEANYNRDNSLALRFLANTPLRDTRALRDSVGGLSWKDKVYLNKMRDLVKGKKFRKFQKAPKDKGSYFEWAIAQLDEKTTGEIQQRALQAFSSQTAQVRDEVKARIEGLFTGAFSPLIKDAGFRASLQDSAVKAMADLKRVFPISLYPKEHGDLAASLFVGMEAATIRSIFDRIPTTKLAGSIDEAATALIKQIQTKLPKDAFARSLPIQTKAYHALQKFVTMETKERHVDPYGSLKRISKDVRGLEKRLGRDEYVTFADKVKDQSSLRRRVVEEANKLEVTPTFLSGNDLLTMTSLAKMGSMNEVALLSNEMRDKYGDVTYFDYIVPQIAKQRVFGPSVLAAAIVPDREVSGLISQAAQSSSANLKILTEQKADLVPIQAYLAEEGNWWSWIFEEKLGFGEKAGYDGPMGHIRGYILDRFLDGREGHAALTGLRKAAGDLAMQYMVAGTFSKSDEAVEAAVETITNGLGTPAYFQERMTIMPANNPLSGPQMDLLSDVLRDESFLRKRVYPEIAPNIFINNLSGVTGKSVHDIFDRWFTDLDSLKWLQSFEGIYPVVENPSIPGMHTSIPTHDNQPFMIPFTELPTMIVKDYK